MCGRYGLGASGADLIARFGAVGGQAGFEWTPRYNVAPSQQAPVVIRDPDRRLVRMRWGLVPAWSRTPRPAYQTINARLETLHEKPTYRQLLGRRRCLVPATGFYEWQVLGGSARGTKQAYHMQVCDDGDAGGLFAFAGLYDLWRAPDGDVLATYTIVTTDADLVVAPIHARMPVILAPEAEGRWLDPALADPTELLRLLAGSPPRPLRAYPVSAAVNSPAHDGPELLTEVSPPPRLL